jgi:mono/diheme cytochrome c family protein
VRRLPQEGSGLKSGWVFLPNSAGKVAPTAARRRFLGLPQAARSLRYSGLRAYPQPLISRKLEAMMKSLIVRLRGLAFVFAGVMIAATFLIVSVPARSTSAPDDDTAALYKTKCFACHGATAEKKFDATKPDDELIQLVLKGKKLEKPPNMPAFEERGLTPDQAKALVAFMKSQRH